MERIEGETFERVEEEEPEEEEPDQLPHNAKTVTVYRATDDGHREYCQRWSAESWSPEELRRLWGGGHYVLRVQDRAGKWVRNRTLDIAGAPRVPGPRDAERPDNPDAPPLDRIDRLEAAILRLTERVEGAAQPRRSGSDLATVAELGKVTSSQFENMVALFKAMAPAPSSGGALDADKLLDFIMKGVEMGKDMAGIARGDGDRTTAIVEKFGVPIIEWLRSQEGEKKEAQPAAAPQAGAPPQPATVTLPPVRPMKPSPLAELTPQMPFLIELARSNADPVMWAITLESRYADQMDVLAAMADRAGKPALIQDLVETFPTAEPYRAWFTRLLDELLEEAPEEEPGASDAE